MMSNLVELVDDIAARLEVMARELNHPYRFLEIARCSRMQDRKTKRSSGLNGGSMVPLICHPTGCPTNGSTTLYLLSIWNAKGLTI